MDVSVEDFKKSTVLYDALKDRMNEQARKSSSMNALIDCIKYITDKNNEVLYTNIVGPSLLINEEDQKRSLAAIGTTKEEMAELCKTSPRLQSGSGIGKIVDQFSFALPLLILSGQLHKLGKDVLSQGIFLFVYYRAYSSKVSLFWTMGTVDEKAMLYTVQVELTDKSYIHKYGTVYNTLVESAKTAWTTYIDILAGSPKKPTDDMIFNNIFYSAVFSKTGSWLKSLYGTYKSVKASGKYLDYEQSTYATFDDDSQSDEYEENPIESDSAVKRRYVTKAVSKFAISPLDSKLIEQAARFGFRGNKSPTYETYLSQAISKISEIKSDEIPQYFDSIVGMFLELPDANGVKNTGKDIDTIKFPAYCKRDINVSHTSSNNVITCRNMTREFLEQCSTKYMISGATHQNEMRYALFMYFVYFIQKA
jgi:hypothetical protein